MIGTQLGDYTIRRLIGRGGMARVYEGYDERLERQAAVKVIERREDQDQELTQRFFREARAIARLDHPNIVVLYQFGEVSHLYYLAMKLIDGHTLLSELKKLRQHKKFMAPATTVKMMQEIASALDYAHSRGIIHRDIKPSNIMLTDDGRAILMDFGLTMESNEDSTLGTAFGTPRYIAPEQAISSQRAVPQSDIYGLGVVLYEIATGQSPFDGESPMELALSHITNPVPLPRSVRHDLTLPVETVILKALEKRPENRWQTAGAMAEALQKAYAGIPPSVVITQAPFDPPTQMIKPTGLLESGNHTPILQAAGAASSVVAVPQRAPEVRPKRSNRLAVRLLIVILALIAIGGLTLLTIKASKSYQSDVILLPSSTPSSHLRLIYSPDSLAIYNATGHTVSLENLAFIHGTTSNRLELSRIADASGYKDFLDKQCLRLMKRTADHSAMPDVCGPQYAPISLDNPGDIFWTTRDGSDQTAIFQIKWGVQTLQTCLIILNTCEFALP